MLSDADLWTIRIGKDEYIDANDLQFIVLWQNIPVCQKPLAIKVSKSIEHVQSISDEVGYEKSLICLENNFPKELYEKATQDPYCFKSIDKPRKLITKNFNEKI